MRTLALIVLLVVCGGAPGKAQASSLSQPSLGVSFISVTNASKPSEGQRINGIFQITNRLKASVYIYTQRIEVGDGSSWKFLSGTSWEPLGLINPHEQLNYETWVPERGGMYRLALHADQEEYFSQPFRVSPGPPAELIGTQHIIIVPTNFIRQITSADKVIVEQRHVDTFGPLSISLTGKKAHDVVKAISSLREDRIKEMVYPYCGCEDLELHFYHGDRSLGKANFDAEMVEIDIEYRYKGGVLKNLADEMTQKMDKAIEKWEAEQTEKLMRDEQSRRTN